MLSLRAQAKLNLALAVGPPQPPRGYHPICSWFAPIDLHDTVTVRMSTAGSSTHAIDWAADALVRSPIDWPLDRDLAVRAHRLVEQRLGRELPADIRVHKRIPVGGGLGGGSSDAAAVMLGLDRAFELGLSAETLAVWSETLGSDVAYFIASRCGQDSDRRLAPAIISGFGEVIEPVEPVPGEAVLIFPPFGCPTGAVYQAFDQDPGAATDPQRVDDLVCRSIDQQVIASDELFNDLFAPACRIQPALGPLRESCDRAAAEIGARVHMTGSGSTLFSIVPPGQSAEDVVAAVRAAATGCGLVVVRLE